MKTLLLGMALLGMAAGAQAQGTPPTYGCDSPESKQFDFWVGEWDAVYKGPDGKESRSRNRVSKILEGCGVLEQFSGAPDSKLNGHSISTYERAGRKWRQAWVDNTAAYLDFSGGFADGKMILARETERQGRKMRMRMVWQDIRPDAFKWLYQSSADEGATWATQWEIDYTRVK